MTCCGIICKSLGILENGKILRILENGKILKIPEKWQKG